MEKAKNYAESKVRELAKALEDAYVAGYNDGVADSSKTVSKENYTEESEFVDLGLSSGTLWSADYLKEGDEIVYLPFVQAKEYQLPSKEQWEELVEECEKIEYYNEEGDLCSMRFVGLNGNVLTLEAAGYMEIEEEREGPNEITIRLSDSKAIECNRYGIHNWDAFVGYRLPVRLVKNK